MADVYLLGSRFAEIPETGQKIGEFRLKLGEGVRLIGIVEIVVSAERLAVVDVVVQLHAELISMLMGVGNRLEDVVDRRRVWKRNILVQQIGGNRIETRGWDLAVRKDPTRSAPRSSRGDCPADG